MNIAISGHTGFIGTHLTRFFENKGYGVTGIGRKDFKKGVGHLSKIISSSDILINLSGAPIIRRWTRRYSRELWNSRILTTEMLVKALEQSAPRPRAFFSSSAIGIYASQGIHTEKDHRLDEDFLGTLCQRWEEEAFRARLLTRVYVVRTGIVLGKEGGALPSMARPFRLGVGGKIGDGRQMISWIHIHDFVNAMDMLIEKMPRENVFNFTAPQPVSNADMSKVLARTLHRPNIFRVPAFALKLLFGEGAVVLLTGQHVLPHNLQNAGYTFAYPELDDALHDLLGK